MKFYLIIVFLSLFLVQKKLTAQNKENNVWTQQSVDSQFIVQMCLGKTLAYYKAFFVSDSSSLIKVKVYDFRNILIVEGYYFQLKRGKLQAEGEWKFYNGEGLLRKSGNFKKGFKYGFWFDYNNDGTENYRTYYFELDKIASEKITILNVGFVTTTYSFDMRELAYRNKE